MSHGGGSYSYGSDCSCCSSLICCGCMLFLSVIGTAIFIVSSLVGLLTGGGSAGYDVSVPCGTQAIYRVADLAEGL
ncbi:hypothetical protein KIPB_016719, partial [Kipferlia bialata]|eukprot:g16719.t1